MLEDGDRSVRGRAAETIAHLSESHPSRLLRILELLKEGLLDESAYVRWHLAFALGEIGVRFPSKTLTCCLTQLANCLEDEHQIVRLFALRALERLAPRKPEMMRAHFLDRKREIPSDLAVILQKAE
jgi:HEAT repeat protein